VRTIDDLQEARSTGTGLVSLDSSIKKGESPLTQADAPESIKTVSLLLVVALIALILTLSGVESWFGGWLNFNLPELMS
jgi:hypothetical protein